MNFRMDRFNSVFNYKKNLELRNFTEMRTFSNISKTTKAVICDYRKIERKEGVALGLNVCLFIQAALNQVGHSG